MEATIIIASILLVILQIYIIVYFFDIAKRARHIAAGVKAIKDYLVKFDQLNGRQEAELEKYLGHIDKAREIFIRERVKKENEYRYRYYIYEDTSAVEKYIQYLDEQLHSMNVNVDELLDKVYGIRSSERKEDM